MEVNGQQAATLCEVEGREGGTGSTGMGPEEIDFGPMEFIFCAYDTCRRLSQTKIRLMKTRISIVRKESQKEHQYLQSYSLRPRPKGLFSLVHQRQ